MLNNEISVCPCPNTFITNRELEDTINKFGSLVTLVTNKPVSCITFFIFIQKYPELQKTIVENSGVTWYTIVEYLAHRYPVLNKSKKIKNEHTK